MKILTSIFVLVIFSYIYVWSGGTKGKENINNCMALNIGATKKQVIDKIGRPNSEHKNGLQLQYYPTLPFSSCQIVLEFDKNEVTGQLLLSNKFCDDGVEFICHS